MKRISIIMLFFACIFICKAQIPASGKVSQEKMLERFLSYANNLELLEKMRIYPFQMIDWINQLAIGEGLSKVFKPEVDNLGEPRKSIKKLQEHLKLCGVEAMNQAKGESKTPVSGFSFVSMPDNQLYRDIAFCGNFPADNPRYGIFVWLHKKENSDESLVQERKELGVHAAEACKTVVDYLLTLS